MILVIDNYDSFTYNLVQYMGEINPDISVYRNDAITADEVLAMDIDHILLSPGPGYPVDAGICMELIQKNAAREITIPLLGVCLGHQAIGEAFGATIVHAPRIMHGKSDAIEIDMQSPLLAGLSSPFIAGRYHSLVVDPKTMPDCLKQTGESSDGCIMALEHRSKPIYGIQFHPESVLTPEGKALMRNFLTNC